MTDTEKQSHDYGDVPNPDCDMPECVGTREDDAHAVRDVSGEVLEMCDGCLDAGWSANVEVLD